MGFSLPCRIVDCGDPGNRTTPSTKRGGSIRWRRATPSISWSGSTRKGKIRRIGMGARNLGVLRLAIASGNVDIVLTYLEYNLYNLDAAAELFPLAREGVSECCSQAPLGMGLLSGVEEVVARASEYSDNAINPERVAKARAMWDWARNRGLDIRHLAIQFCLAAPVQGDRPARRGDQAAGRGDVRSGHRGDSPQGSGSDFEAEFGVGNGGNGGNGASPE